MNITVLMENTALEEGYLFDHGLSLDIRTEKHHILFDMGPSADFAANAARAGIDLSTVDLAVLSHGHFDHGGGLETFLALNDHAPVYLSRHAFEPHYAEPRRAIGLKPELAADPRMVFVDDRLRIDDELELLTYNDQPRPCAMDTYGLFSEQDGELVPDDFRHEQYLLIREKGRRVLISGCSHKGVLNLMHWCRPDVLIGGFHFMKVEMDGSGLAVLDGAACGLMACPAQYYTCHCTGAPQYAYLQTRMDGRLHYLATGQRLTP